MRIYALFRFLMPIIVLSAMIGNGSSKEFGAENLDSVFSPGTLVRVNPYNGTIQYLKLQFISGDKNALSEDSLPRDIALHFIVRYKDHFKLQQPQDELRCLSVLVDDLGITHVKFQQVYSGIPIWAAELNVHFDQNNRLYLVQGHYIPTPSHIEPKPRVSSSSALEFVMKELGVQAGRRDSKIELVIFQENRKPALLAYKVSTSEWLFFVDAANGFVVEKIHTRHMETPANY